MATALLGGGGLPTATYRAARDLLGQGALNELVLWVGMYAPVSIALNAFDVPSERVFDDDDDVRDLFRRRGHALRPRLLR